MYILQDVLALLTISYQVLPSHSRSFSARSSIHCHQQCQGKKPRYSSQHGCDVARPRAKICQDDSEPKSLDIKISAISFDSQSSCSTEKSEKFNHLIQTTLPANVPNDFHRHLQGPRDSLVLRVQVINHQAFSLSTHPPIRHNNTARKCSASPDEFWRNRTSWSSLESWQRRTFGKVIVSIQWCTIDPETMVREEKGMGFKIVANFRIFSICQGQWKNCSFPAVFLYQFIASLVVMSPTSCSLPTSQTLGEPWHGQRYRRQGASAPDTWRTSKRSWHLDIHSIWNTKGCGFGKDWTPEFRPHGYAEFRQLQAGANSMENSHSFFSGALLLVTQHLALGNDPKTPLGTAKDPIYKSKWWCISVITFIHTTTINWWNAQHHSSEAWNWMQSKHA